MEYCNNILETIGNTPLVKLNQVVKEIPALVLMKVETFNPGHSIKDRMALKMVNDAEKRGDLTLAAALCATFWFGALLGTAAVAFLARGGAPHDDLVLAAGHRVLEADAGFHPHVLPAHRGLPATPAPAPAAPKNVGMKSTEHTGVSHTLPAATRPGHRAGRPAPNRSFHRCEKKKKRGRG